MRTFKKPCSPKTAQIILSNSDPITETPQTPGVTMTPYDEPTDEELDHAEKMLTAIKHARKHISLTTFVTDKGTRIPILSFRMLGNTLVTAQNKELLDKEDWDNVNIIPLCFLPTKALFNALNLNAEPLE